jgi:hypothetical protein
MSRRRLAVPVAVALVLAACGGPLHGLTTFTPVACVVTLPAAKAAVGGHGKLIAVKPFHRQDLEPVFHVEPRHPVPTRNPLLTPTLRVCLVVYQDDYQPGSVLGAPAGSTGTYAMLLVRIHHPRVLLVRLVDVLPRLPK